MTTAHDAAKAVVAAFSSWCGNCVWLRVIVHRAQLLLDNCEEICRTLTQECTTEADRL